MKQFLSILILLGFLAGSASAAVVIKLKKTVEVCSKDILLVDLVDEWGDLPSEWKARRVLAAPPAGEMSYHALTAIAYALSRFDDMQNVTLSGEPVIAVSRKDRKMAMEEFHDPILSYLKETDPWKGQDIGIKVLNIPSNTHVPVGETKYRIRRIDQKTSKGYSLAHVAVIVDGVEAVEVPVGLEINLMTEVWVIAHNLEMGHILESSDLRSEMHEVDATANHVSSTEDLVGYEVTRTLTAGNILRSIDVSKPLCAKRGEWVAINAIGKNLQITLRGKAMANGRLGDRIMCVNERSNRQVLVELTGMGNGVLVRL
ncbi:MAG: flagellar basal body P-ring formation protein FlgA [Pontiellaceae bacterium]|nr:flagellar basal body P-ring formation protein FlgA [Pontiellaceae bacterium]MBN2784129.1 flagellar basal body P-ring formation protein FlgA [Pontiellaceae bacterium]